MTTHFTNGCNAPSKPQFEGQLVKFQSPHHPAAVLLDVAVRNEKYGCLEWVAVNPDDPEYYSKLDKAVWANW